MRYSGFGVKGDRSFECLVVLGVFQTSDHRLGCQYVSDGVDP
jgi:hypothetical protein